MTETVVAVNLICITSLFGRFPAAFEVACRWRLSGTKFGPSSQASGTQVHEFRCTKKIRVQNLCWVINKSKVHSNLWNTNSCWLTNNKGKITKFDKIKIRSQYFYPKGQEHQANSLLGFKIQANHMWSTEISTRMATTKLRRIIRWNRAINSWSWIGMSISDP